MDVILVPGLWLNASTWDRVVPLLAGAGHRPVPLTLPGMESLESDRSAITLSDHVSAVVAAIDAASGPVLLVGHSAGCGIAHAALDARVDRVGHAVHVGGFPTPDGEVLLEGLPAVDGAVPMPDWAAMGEEANLVDLSADEIASFYAAAIPVPEGVLTEPVRLGDERRYAVPATALCPEYRADQLRAWVDSGDPGIRELGSIRSLTYVDLPTGHWPQLTKPRELADILLGIAAGLT